MTHRTNISFKLDHHISISTYIDLCIYLSTLLGKEINCTVWLAGSNQTLEQKVIGTLRSDNSNSNKKIINKEIISLRSKTTTLHMHHTFFCKFLCHFCTTMVRKCLISCFIEDINNQRWNFLSLLNLKSQIQERSHTFNKVSRMVASQQ